MNTGNKIFVFQCMPYVSEEEIAKLINSVQSSPQFETHTFYFAVPYTSLAHFTKTNTPQISFGALGMNSVAEDSFTRNTSVSMLQEAGAKFVLVGSSFYRQLYEETNATLDLKLQAALEGGLIPVFCLGEGKGQDAAEKSAQIVKAQLEEGLVGLMPEQVQKIVFLYEAPCFFKPNTEVLVKACAVFQAVVEQILGKEAGAHAVIVNAIPNGTRNLEEVLTQVQGGGFYSGEQQLIGDLLQLSRAHEPSIQTADSTVTDEPLDTRFPEELAGERAMSATGKAVSVESLEATAEPLPKTRAPRKKRAVVAEIEDNEA